jgi:GR25 family glycosyltransferase involved in LPS biosynthesis
MELLKNTFYINLEHRKDRLEHVRLELVKLGIEGERINAVSASNGAIGCTLSHIRCLEEAKKRNYQYVFICEDDITFTNSELLLKNLKKFYEEDNMLWDMIIIGGNNVPPYQKINDNCVRVFYCQTTTGYIIRNSYYDTLLKNFKESANLLMRNPTEEGKKKYALDIYWKRLQIQDFWYMITPPTVTQYENYSDIEKRNTDYKHLMLDMDKKWFFHQGR